MVTGFLLSDSLAPDFSLTATQHMGVLCGSQHFVSQIEKSVGYDSSIQITPTCCNSKDDPP